jgi:hypothetical protein
MDVLHRDFCRIIINWHHKNDLQAFCLVFMLVVVFVRQKYLQKVLGGEAWLQSSQ